MVAAVAIGVGVLSAGATAYAGNQASGAVKAGNNAAIAQQQRALDTQTGMSQPYRDIGTAAIPQYEALLGIGPKGSAGIEEALQSDPRYKFALEQGQTGILNAASAQGGITGNTLEALNKFNVGEASQTYGQAIGDLQSAVGLGQAAAAGQAQNVGNAAGNIGSIYRQQGQDLAGIDAATIAGISKAFGNTTNSLAAMGG